MYEPVVRCTASLQISRLLPPVHLCFNWIDGHNSNNGPAMHTNSGGGQCTVAANSISHWWVLSTRCYISL